MEYEIIVESIIDKILPEIMGVGGLTPSSHEIWQLSTVP